MEFTQKYILIELLAGDGVQSYRAVQTSTGRDVAVHLLVGGKTPENEALLVRLRAMQPQSMAKLIEVGEQQGNTYVVTMAPPYQRLDEWLAEQIFTKPGVLLTISAWLVSALMARYILVFVRYLS